MDYINVLENKTVLSIGRSFCLLWINFGEEGEQTEKRKYVLDFQCPWRIEDESNSAIVLASHDMYEPNSQTEWSEDFEWDIQGNNLFDEKIKQVFPDTDTCYVKKVSVSPYNDLNVHFSNGLVLKSFIDVSSETECWSFFEKGADEHLIIYGKEISFE